MKAGPIDVFWFQERWKAYVDAHYTLHDWLDPASGRSGKPLRVLVWLAGVADSWRIPPAWMHPDATYEVALTSDQTGPVWLPEDTCLHRVSPAADRDSLRKSIAAIDESAVLPVDFILTTGAPKALCKAGRREAVPVVSLP